MSWKIAYRREAKKEFDKAYDWYESEKEGLGEEFAQCVQDELNHLAKNPKIHAKVYKDARRAVVKRFPFCVYYVIQNGLVQIISVFDARQNPSKWQSRV